MPPNRRLVLAGALSLFVLAAKLLPLPPLRDAVTGAPAPEFSLRLPAGYLLTAPWSAFADLATIGSARQDKVLIAYLLLGYWVWFFVGRWTRRFILFETRSERRARRTKALWGYPVYLALVAAFLAWALLARRPAAAFVSAHADDLVLDLHSHTSYSWDGRKRLGAFTPQANMDWHRRLGFTAAFITDHNKTTGAREAKVLSRKRWKQDGYRSLEGEEVSLHDLHVAVLGNHYAIDNQLYDKDLAGAMRFFKDAPKFGGLTVLSLPEYWAHYPQTQWDKFAQAGASGFEIVNSVPKALEFPASLSAEVVRLCRRRRLFFDGVTDNHGWGSATAVWSVMRLKGQASMDPDRLEREVLAKLRRDGPEALRVIVRAKHEPSASAWIAFDPPASVWTFARTFSWAESLMCLAWIWLLALLSPSLEI